jgi:hypothetical protein
VKITMRFEHAVVGALTFVLITAAASLSAQDLAVLHARSLNDVFDGVERISKASGQPVDRQELMGQATAMFGIDPGQFLDLERPVAVAMPVQGMMLQQNGLVAAVPVTDSAAAIDALKPLFESHTTDGELDVFSRAGQPMLYLMQAEGYVRVGGNRDLVTGFDPLAGVGAAADVSLEIFLEPVAPMISAGLQAVKEQLKSELEAELDSAVAGEEEVTVDSEALGPFFDFYVDGVQKLLANTSSIRLALDVDQTYAFFSKTLVAKKDSSLATFFAAQKAGVPETAGLADPSAAFYLAGTMSFDEEHRSWLKGFVERYMDVATAMFDSIAEGEDADTAADAEASDERKATMRLWKDYMTAMGGLSDRWVDCWRGDVVGSFDLPEGEPFTFTEIFGLSEEEGCRSLIADMGDQIRALTEENQELARIIKIEEGPAVGDAPSLLMEMDVMEMIDASGQPMEAEAEAAMKALYGERLSVAMASVGDHAVITGGGAAAEQLQSLVPRLSQPAAVPSLAPLSEGPGMSMLLNIGRFLEGMKGVVPEGELDLDGPMGGFRGEAGRIPMALRFDSESATFELAMSMKTIETIAAVAEEERAAAAAAEVSTGAEMIEEEID